MLRSKKPWILGAKLRQTVNKIDGKFRIIHEENTKKITAVSVVYINFSFDFLGSDNVDFENYFANKLINMGRF